MEIYTPKYFNEKIDLKESDEVKEITFDVKKIGRKWIQAFSKWKDYNLEFMVEINNITKSWVVGEKYTVTATIKVDKSNYGTKRYAFPVEVNSSDFRDKQKNKEQQELVKNIDKYLGWIEDKIDEYWYAKGETAVNDFINRLEDSTAKEEYKKKLFTLKNNYLKSYYPKEIDRWIGYIKKNLDTYWYSKGETEALKYAKALGKDAERKTQERINELKSLFNARKDSERQQKQKNIINISMSLYDYSIGDVVFNKELDKYIYIKKINSRYVGVEDAPSIGGNFDGYVITAEYRDATESEIEKVKMEALKTREYKDKIKKIEAYFNKKVFIIPDSVKKTDIGVFLHVPEKGHNIYGGGRAFGITPNRYLWVIENNGGDGDNWSHNNFSTGGAGAIAYRYPFNREIEKLLTEVCVEGL